MLMKVMTSTWGPYPNIVTFYLRYVISTLDEQYQADDARFSSIALIYNRFISILYIVLSYSELHVFVQYVYLNP